jgi:enoyl-CoA hydratase
LVNRVVPTAETVREAVGLAHRLAALPPYAVQEARRLLNSQLGQATSLLSECARAESACFDTEEHRAAVEQLSGRLAAKTGES